MGNALARSISTIQSVILGLVLTSREQTWAACCHGDQLKNIQFIITTIQVYFYLILFYLLLRIFLLLYCWEF